MLGFGLVTVVAVAACSSSGDGTTAETPSTPVAPAGSDATSGATGSVPADGLTLTSSAFADGGSIPLRYACVNQGGENASPPLAWSGVPDGTESLVLVVHDPDAPLPGGFTHLVTTISPDVASVEDGANLAADGPMLRWIGPCPPSGEHHYEFTLYAFGPGVIGADADRAAVDAVSSEALAVAQLTGVFANPS